MPPAPTTTAAHNELLRAYLTGPGGACPKCRYDLTGLDTTTCPECGHHLQLILKGTRTASPLARTAAATVYVCAGAFGLALLAIIATSIDFRVSRTQALLSVFAVVAVAANITLAEAAGESRAPVLTTPRSGTAAIVPRAMTIAAITTANALYAIIATSFAAAF